MKKLKLLISLLLTVTTLGSQPVLDSAYTLTPRVLKLIRIELTELDFIKDTLAIHAKKDSLINIKLNQYQAIIERKNDLIENKNLEIEIREEDIIRLKHDVKVQKKKVRKQKIITIATGVGAILLIILLI